MSEQAPLRQFLEQARPFRSVLAVGPHAREELQLARELAPGADFFAAASDPAAVAAARAEGISALALDIDRDALPFQSGTIDVAVLGHVLEYAQNPSRVLHEITRVLPVGGALLLSVANPASIVGRIQRALGLGVSGPGFTRRRLVRLFADGFPNGYRIAELRGQHLQRLPSLSRTLHLHLVKQREYQREFLEPR